MSEPWSGDACSLVEEFRARRRSPLEELDATLAAIERSELNSFSFVDADAARAAAAEADTSQPFGGVPLGIKELTDVEGWPKTEASVVLRDHVASRDSTSVTRLRTAGAVPVGLTTASEFGGISLTYTKLNGATANPWDLERSPGGSSGGSAAAVAGGLVTLATGGDGGGSIRIPAAFTGLPGLKATYGRIPRAPNSSSVHSRPRVDACRARCATSRAGSTSPTVSTRTTRPACRVSTVGKPDSVPRSCAGCASRCRVTSVVRSSTTKLPTGPSKLPRH